MVVLENERGGTRLPTFCHRRIRSEVQVPDGQRGCKEERSGGRTEGSHKEHDRRSNRKHQRTVSPKRRKHNHSRASPPRHERNPIWRQLQQISLSPFSTKIEQAKLPTKFTSPNLTVYNRNSDPVGHLSQYKQVMALYSTNDALMCRMFPSSLGEVGLRWFDRLEHGSIRSWKEMSKAFTERFITNTRKPKEIDTLLALTMKAEETLKSYSARYWEVYNDIDVCDENLVVKTFRFGLHQGSRLKQSLTKRPATNMTDLMSRLEQHIRVEDDSKSSVRTAEVAPATEKKVTRPESSRAKKARSSTDPPKTGMCLAVYTMFKEPIYRILPLIKDKPYFVWPPKMGGDPAKRESKSYCAFHQERGHLTKKCQTYKSHLEHLVKNGHLKQYVDDTAGRDQRGEMRKVAHLRETFQIGDSAQMAPRPLRKESVEQIVFTDQDLERVQLPHSDALVITLRIREFNIKRILIDPGSSAEIMYEPLFRGLGIGAKDLNCTEGPLYGFSGKTVVPSGKCHNPIFTPGIFSGVGAQNGTARTRPDQPSRDPSFQNDPKMLP
uniref:Retrotransposon gag domain-containing protein n=1 Tax=Fagus sylvatica TaxID=28930 RepID=A0A2N9FEF2_FAGSY